GRRPAHRSGWQPVQQRRGAAQAGPSGVPRSGGPCNTSSSMGSSRTTGRPPRPADQDQARAVPGGSVQQPM
ncbi:MAG: hypothetical protein AVDCRST_MAG08-808, partial [uncultured Acetobacteraceae bacterium]